MSMSLDSPNWVTNSLAFKKKKKKKIPVALSSNWLFYSLAIKKLSHAFEKRTDEKTIYVFYHFV